MSLGSLAGRTPGAAAGWPDKVQPWHQDRLAVVYVRQSTAQQVLVHQESARLQYGLTARARELGWAADRVLVIGQYLGQLRTLGELLEAPVITGDTPVKDREELFAAFRTGELGPDAL